MIRNIYIYLQLDGSYVTRQVKTWSRQYEASKTEDIDAMNKVMEWLPKNVPPQVKNSIVHGDSPESRKMIFKDRTLKKLKIIYTALT